MVKKKAHRFFHIPHYWGILCKALRTPMLIVFTVSGNALLLLSAYLFFQFEVGVNPGVDSFFDAIWWAFSTVSTVGFGDITPVTTKGRVVGIFLMDDWSNPIYWIYRYFCFRHFFSCSTRHC